MDSTNLKLRKNDLENQENNQNIHRRSFLKYAGIGAAGAALVVTGCKIKKNSSDTLKLGKGDFAILNYAYALEQLEAAFYEKITANFYPNVSPLEKEFLTDIKNDEIAHREWFKKVLFLNKIQDLKYEFDFSSINFGNRESVLKAAKVFEDTGVSAYNGAGPLLKLSPFLSHAGKIVSVEARHAATIRNLLNYGSFAASDVVDKNGLDQSRNPQEVVNLTAKFFKTKLDVSDFPYYKLK